jgi:archaemetzincin
MGLGKKMSVSTNVHCEGGLNSARKQWLASEMIELCVRPYASRSCYAVGLTDKDLYVPQLNFVFGLAVREVSAAIVSWHRLVGNEGAFNMRIVKEVIHELGHLEGLDHCPNEVCVMRFSNTLGETDRKRAEFCATCRLKRKEHIEKAS